MLDINHLIDWKQLTVNVIIGYAVSWIYFLVSLALFRKTFGIVNGGICSIFIKLVSVDISDILVTFYKSTRR